MTVMSSCNAKIRPFTDRTELTCDATSPEADEVHEHHSLLRDYAGPGSETIIYWLEGDRRTFRGRWRPCGDNEAPCTLPRGHVGRHAP